MAQIRYVVKNRNTGKVVYKGIKASGTYEEMYSKLNLLLRQFMNERMELYEDRTYYIRGRYRRPKKAFGTPYISYRDCAYDYIFSLVK